MVMNSQIASLFGLLALAIYGGALVALVIALVIFLQAVVRISHAIVAISRSMGEIADGMRAQIRSETTTQP
jgi:hypothetical protein